MRNIMVLDKEDFNNYYGQELLANLESCPQIRFGDTLNFETKTIFNGTQNSSVSERASPKRRKKPDCPYSR